jgi:4'-phosphopantetheinyl transferase
MKEVEGRGSEMEGRLPPDVRLHRLRYDAAHVAAWRALLSEEECARLDGYGVEKRQREFLLGRAAARQLLADVLACAPPDVPLAVAESGAVDVRGDRARGLCLSLSHTEGEAAAAVARRPVGVDLERPQPRSKRLHQFLLAEEERPLLKTLPVSESDAFTLCWALKEAVLKALRCGLRRSPKIVRIAEVDVEGGTAQLVAADEKARFEAAFAREGALWLVIAYEQRSAS